MLTSIVIWAAAQSLYTTCSSALESQPQIPLVEDRKHSTPNAYDETPTNGWTLRWHKGVTTGFPDNQAAEANFTGSMAQFMQENYIQQAQLSIALKGEQLANYAFNYNDPSITDVQVDDHFLLASVSKIYCVAAVQKLLSTKALFPEESVYLRLGYQRTDAKDPRVFTITVQNLLEHLGGDDRMVSGDPVYKMRQIALDMSNGSHPATEREIIEWKMQQQLDYNPNDAIYCLGKYNRDFCYSNYDYLLLSYLVQNVTGSPDYYTWLNANVLQPNGLNVTQWLTSDVYHRDDVVQQLDPGFGLSALDPLSNDTVNFIYGGDGIYKESSMGGAALATNAAMLTKTLASYPAWGWNTNRSAGYYRTGSMAGAFTLVTQRWQDDLDMAFVFNTRTFDTDLVWDDLYAKLDQWLNANYSKPKVDMSL